MNMPIVTISKLALLASIATPLIVTGCNNNSDTPAEVAVKEVPTGL